MSDTQEKQNYRAYRPARKQEKIANIMWQINKIKQSMRPQKKADRNIIVVGGKRRDD
jgi:hypothetical protein